VVDNAFDPQNDPLEYDFEVYEDAALTILVASAGGAVAEDASGQTAWKVDVPLTENAMYWWRAAAADPFVWGPWSDAENFVVNTANEPPEAPTPVFPVDGETAALPDVELQWLAGVDPEGDDMTFSVRVWDETATTLVAEADGIFPALDAAGFWVVDPALVEDTWYLWEVSATDDLGLQGAWSELELFFHDTSNAPPVGVVFLDPLQDDVIDTLSPDLVASEGVDPEGGALSYRFEVDTVDTFDSGDLQITDLPGTDTGEVTWDLLGEGVELTEDTIVWARVRAIDVGAVGSEWDVISFFVAGDNTAPPMPLLLAPEDGAETDQVVPTLVVGNVQDPEGDLVFYDFVLARDLEMTDVVTAHDEVLAGSGSQGDQDQTSWTVDLNLEGDYFWTARATDVVGASSDWAEPFALHVATGLGDDDDSAGGDDDDDDGGGGGCDCESSLGGHATGAPSWALLALIGLVALRRRR
jgi:MYXO-CTERM domain-containing protein